MEDNVIKELETLEQMVINWKNSYLQGNSPGEGYEFLADELSQEISEYVSPLVQRMVICNYLTTAEGHEFMGRCYKHVEELRLALSKPVKQGLWTKVVQVFERK